MLYHAKAPLPGAKVIEPERVVFTDEGLHYEMGLVYGKADGKDLLMDCIYPKGIPEPLPCVLWIHGGGWASHDLTRVYRPERQMAELAKLGFVCASIDYRLSDEAVFPAQLEDCKCAVRYLRAHAEELHIDPKHIASWGESAGGHLAAMLAVTNDMEEFEGSGGWSEMSSNVQAAVAWYPPCDLPALQHYYGKEADIIAKLVGVPIDDASFEKKAWYASPACYVSRKLPPMLLMHGDRDSLVPHAQSEDFCKSARAAGNPVRLITVHDQGHGFFDGQEYAHAIENFFFQHLKGVDRARELMKGEGGHVVWEPPFDWAAADIRYLPDQVFATPQGIELKADWFLPKKAQHPMPVVVWFHGGGWRSEELNRRYRPDHILAALCRRGFACVSADYRLLQQAPYPAPIEDARCVIRYIRAKANEMDLDSEHIGVWGESAGAATALLLGVGEYLPEQEGNGGYAEYSSRVQAVCSWYGFANHIKQAELSGMEQNHFINVTYDIDGPGAKKLYHESVFAYANRSLPPFLLMHGSADPLVPLWQSVDLYNELKSWGNDVELYIVPGEVHGFFMDPKVPNLIVDFFSKHLMLK